MKKSIPITELAKRLTDATKSDLYVDIDIVDGKYNIPLEVAIALGLVLTDSDVFKRKDSVGDITYQTKLTALSAGANSQAHDFSDQAIRLYAIGIQNPDGAARNIVATLRDPVDADMMELGKLIAAATPLGGSLFQINSAEYYFMQFPGGIEIPYNWDILIKWAAMTGSNTSRNTTIYRELNDQ